MRALSRNVREKISDSSGCRGEERHRWFCCYYYGLIFIGGWFSVGVYHCVFVCCRCYFGVQYRKSYHAGIRKKYSVCTTILRSTYQKRLSEKNCVLLHIIIISSLGGYVLTGYVSSKMRYE
jgi:hypothetical protein